MKLILSRKGFDSSAGGVANPILPDGRMLALPIPDAQAPHTFGEVPELGKLVGDLTRGRLGPDDRAHIDPDLVAEWLPRAKGWRPLFGQHGAASGHLANRGVGAGDLFLFFSWFRRVVLQDGVWCYERHAPDVHVIFGWLQVDRQIKLNKQQPTRPWMRYHAHFFGERGKNNELFVGADKLRLKGRRPGLPGAGAIQEFHPDLVLTAPGENRGIWRLPAWFHPKERASALSYHERPERWSRMGRHTRLEAAFRGQEFVLDTDHYPEAIGWVTQLLKGR